MELKVVEATDPSARIRIDGTDPRFVNAIRRTLLADVPKMAIEGVGFHPGPTRAAGGRGGAGAARPARPGGGPPAVHDPLPPDRGGPGQGPPGGPRADRGP